MYVLTFAEGNVLLVENKETLAVIILSLLCKDKTINKTTNKDHIVQT